ncbi:L,D-transpeptidase family protein [Microbacterium karelineae]|uniref:L,D-transpeptidase family protein n=1 Tax=Microbacterium karelineae TaxID=2654283 RepID=UPI0018D27E2C|nr:L,D-transpeptidase family protein [Microbacterium karelineae]
MRRATMGETTMTDLATEPTPTETAQTTEPHVEWVAPAPKKRSAKKLWLGIGIPVVAVAAAGALAFVGTTFIAPGTTVFGADVGMQRVGDARSTIAAHIDEMPITVSVDGAPATFSGADLGLAVDAEQAAQQALSEVPAWQVGEWNAGDIDADLAVDPDAIHAALADEFPDAYADPVNAKIEYVDGAYAVVPAKAGRGIDVDALAAEIGEQLSAEQGVQAIASGETLLAASSSSISVDATVTEQTAAFTTADAEKTAEKLNTTVSGVSFTLDGDVVDEVPAEKVAEWLDVAVTDEGEVDVQAKSGEIQKYVDALPAAVDQEPVDGDVVVDAAGVVSKVLTEGQDGYQVTSTDGIGEQIAAQLTSLAPAEVALTGEKVAHETTERLRSAVVVKSEGMAYFYESVNGGDKQLKNSFSMAIGKPGYDTQVGEFTVYGQLTIQNMGSCDAEGNLVPGGKFDYCTPNVPYPTYFNGDQGFHGTYWHDNFGPGARMSHGCVNLTVGASEWVYSFLQIGSPVSVRA